MCVSPEIIKVKEYMLNRFDSCFSSYKGKRIALYPGECLEDVIKHFDGEYHFCCVMEPDSTQVPPDTDMVIITNFRGVNETDYKNICRSCEENGIPLMDLFGIDQINLHRELEDQKYLTIRQWKDLLSGYDIVSVSIPWAAADRNEEQDTWVVRSRFMILYRWMCEHGKTVVFFSEDDEQEHVLEAEQIHVSGSIIRRKGKTRGYLQLAEQNKGKKIIHIGTNTVIDGIVPREYGIDSRLIRYYSFSREVSDEAKNEGFFTDRKVLLEEINRHDIISFDIFDTLLKRAVLYPQDVFEIVEKRTGVRGFAECRSEIQRSFPQFSLAEIYSHMKGHYGYDDQTTDLLCRTELEVESDLIMPRSSMVDIYDHAKNLGKTVVLVSDMYLDKDFIRKLLEKNGISGYRALYLSYQYKKFKHEGLFEELLKNGVQPGSILHIGDDLFSDYVSAKEFGLDAFHAPSCLDLALKNGYEKAVGMCRTLADRKLLGLGIALGFDDLFQPHADTIIANMVVAAPAMAYLLWVCGRLADKKYDWFLLSSRDGHIIRNAYDRLQKRFPDRLPPGRYFYTSRHAAFLTVMEDLELATRFISMSDHDTDPRALLTDIYRLSPDQLLQWQGESAEEYVCLHKPQISKTAEKYRNFYREYLAQEGISGKNCAVMDFVSEGNCQKMLEKHITDQMDGYYFAIPEYTSSYPENIYYFLDNDLMGFDTLMKIEVYYTSMEPALDHIGEGGIPVFAKEARDRKFLDRIAMIHEQVQIFFDEYMDHLYEPDDEIDKDMVFELCRTVKQYEVENVYFDDMAGQEIKTKHE